MMGLFEVRETMTVHVEEQPKGSRHTEEHPLPSFGLLETRLLKNFKRICDFFSATEDNSSSFWTHASVQLADKARESDFVI